MTDCHSDHCITCGDDGTPMRVEQIDEERGLALCVAEDGAKSTVETALVSPLSTGDSVLVHAGVALVTIARPEAESWHQAAGLGRPAEVIP